MLELCSIASGSSGNCICVGSDNTHLLVDAGISGKRMEQGLNQMELKTSEMQGILITHEHIDHIAGLGVLARRYGIPMYGTAKTIEAVLHTKSVGKIDERLFEVIYPNETFTIGDLTVKPISISHDAADLPKLHFRCFLLCLSLRERNPSAIPQCLKWLLYYEQN